MACRLLVVEDEALIAMMWETIADLAGVEIVGEAATVTQAMFQLDNQEFDMVVLDVHLRGEMSTEVARRLRELNIPTLVSTGDAPSNLPAAYDGMKFATKPFKVDDILIQLSEMCPKTLMTA